MTIIIQTAFDYDQFEFSLYASLFYNPGLSFLFYAVLALFIQSIISNKYLGMGVSGLVILFLGTSLSSSIGIQHPMLMVGNLPNINFTGMNGFNGITKAYNYLALYWLLFVGILAFFSFQLWKRGVATSLKFRFNVMRSNWNKAATLVLTVIGLLFVSSGYAVFYNTNVAVDYLSSNDHLDFRENYERLYKKYENLDGLFPIEMETEVDLYPSEKRYLVRGNYILKNKGNQVLKQCFITEKESITEIALENALLIEHNEEFGTYLFEFDSVVQPNDEIRFTYTIEKQLKGFETSQNIVENGTYIQHRHFELR